MLNTKRTHDVSFTMKLDVPDDMNLYCRLWPYLADGVQDSILLM